MQINDVSAPARQFKQSCGHAMPVAKDYYEQDDSKVRFRARDYGQYPWGRTTKGGAAGADNDALKDVTQALGLYVNNAAAAKGN